MRVSDLVERILLINILLFLFLGGLFFVSETSWTHDGVIRQNGLKYIAAETAELKGKGRITGWAKDAPDFTVTVLTSTIQPVKTIRSKTLDKVSKGYEIALEPGMYIITVDAEGYASLDIKDLEVRPEEDLQINFKFSRKQS